MRAAILLAITLLATGCTTVWQTDPEPWREGCTYKPTPWRFISLPGTSAYTLECDQ